MPSLGDVLARALVGLVKGGSVGALAAAGLLYWFGLTAFGGLPFAIVSVVLTAALAGLVSGRPIWAPGARVEAGLKAFSGALLGVGLLLLLRRYVSFEVALPFGLGQGTPGDLPVVALPLVAAVLGMLFEADHTGSDSRAPTAPNRAEMTPGRARVGAKEEPAAPEAAEDLPGEANADRRRRRL
jgi:hypothetical protein